MTEHQNIKSSLSEERTFDPPQGFADRCGGVWIDSMESYKALHEASVLDLSLIHI